MKIKKRKDKRISHNRDIKNAEHMCNLGYALQLKGHAEEAINYYLKALRINPNYAEAYFNLGLIYHDIGRVDDAIANYQSYIRFNQNDADVYLNIGHAMQLKGQIDEARFYYLKALQLDPDNPQAHNNLGTVFLLKRQFEEAIKHFRKAIHLDPDFAAAYSGSGDVFREQGNLAKAMESYRISLSKDPASAKTHNNLGIVLKDMGKIDDADVCFKNALKIQPDSASHYSNYLCSLNYNPRYDAPKIFNEHLQFAKKFSGPLSSSVVPHSNMRIRNRRLKIGYVSPDFRRHSVAYFIEPVLAAHDKEAFEIFCYSNSVIRDEVSDRLKSNINRWTDITNVPDEEAAQSIRQDGVDILVDLAGHTANNRILLFARKPAPVQVTWIGYPATTGLSSIDYRIVDRYTDPPGMTERFYTEQLIRLPESSLCYLPDRDAPAAGSLPALASGHVTFGSFNNLAKVSHEVISIWTKILKATPDSRLIMKTFSFRDETTRRYIMNIFTENDISAGRIELLSPNPSITDHLNIYNFIDIALDTFPYNGVTTTCEAMWMGVPVITLSGRTPASRAGVSLLSNVGLPELVARTPDEYVSIAVNLAGNPDRLQSLREHLRDTTACSPLCNAKTFTANLETCYRQMWEKWCGSV
jgi:protein O-GlcNAc transferase